MGVTPTSDTINLIRINKWDFEWQGAYLFKKFLKIPAGSMIYANGSYDNTVSISNPNPVLVQSGLNTNDEMFIFIFQFTDYQIGDENIMIDNSVLTNTINNSQYTNNKLVKTIDLIGRKTNTLYNTPILELYDDGSVKKKIIID
ncbi:MAG: hypothetical protein CM15mP112_09670 [Flavobacteriales bacterium]|nr:MAG: hypothetical protein CM15mP112_09670 [Flavobacteriales bacterium]